jgi:hypothetical protein
MNMHDFMEMSFKGLCKLDEDKNQGSSVPAGLVKREYNLVLQNNKEKKPHKKSEQGVATTTTEPYYETLVK